MIEEMKYKMTVIIANPDTPKGMTDERVKNLDASLFHDPDECGNGCYIRIYITAFSYEFIDLRYDEEFDPNNMTSYLEKWARKYWGGEEGNYCVKWLKITQKE